MVSRLLCKFQFVNEDILRTQTMNEFTSYTNRDRLVDQKLFSSLLSTTNNAAILHPSHHHFTNANS